MKIDDEAYVYLRLLQTKLFTLDKSLQLIQLKLAEVLGNLDHDEEEN